MYGSWTENVVLWRFFLEIIKDLFDVFTVHICSARAQIQSLKFSYIVFLRDDFENRFFRNYSITTTKNVVKFYSKLIRCLETGWENKS